MALLWKMICNLGDPMSLRHPVHIHMCNMLRSCVWHDSPSSSLTALRDMTNPCVWHVKFMSATWWSHMRDVTQSYVRHDAFICVMCLRIHVGDTTQHCPHSCVWHDSPSSSLAALRDMTNPCVWHVKFIQGGEDATHSHRVAKIHAWIWGGFG